MPDAVSSLEAFDENNTSIKIGGKTYFIPPLNWSKLRTIFPYIRKNAENPSDDIADQVYMSAVIISAAIIDKHPEFTPDEIMNRIGFRDTTEFLSSCQQLLAKSGFEMMGPSQGEAQAASHSTETSIDSSPNAQSEESAGVIGSA